MIPRDRWQRIKDIFNSAVNLPAAERTKFVSEACDGDDSLRQEVESLISAHEEEDNFLDAPVHELAAEMLKGNGPALIPGQQLGPYTILSPLGSGGMGEVYLAQDERLGRRIALKLLGREFARDEHRVRRFEQEARAASALNHHNVCVIHEIGKTEDGRHFMAMEYIDGLTLRDRMAQKRLSLKEVLEVGVQVAGALEVAHAAGIVHRDIKPENIMLRRDGYVKVLDFGIAKLNAHPPRLRDAREATTVARLHTAPGTLMGTAKYMSPEQLREQPVDQRSDIWSLGVVLHEMITGFTPFEAGSTNETIAVILEKQPPRLGFDTGGVPEEFQQLVQQALSKKRSERYQTISQLRSDLEKLLQQISADARTEKLEPPIHSIETTAGSQRESRAAAAVSTVFSRVKWQALRTAELVLSEIKQHKTAAVFTGVTAVFALLFVGLGSPGLFSRKPSAGSTPAMMMTPVVNKQQITNTGKSVCAAISPDGKSVAYAEQGDGQQLVTTVPGTSGRSTIVPPAQVAYLGVTFSRDGQNLYFVRTYEKGEGSALYQVALPGGAPRKIKDDVDSPISFSPTGDRFAFVRVNQGGEHYSLIVADVDGSNERELARSRKGSDFSIYGPAWSPDGESVVTAAGSWDNGYHMDLVEISVADGQEKTIGGRRWFSVRQAAWLEDKSGLIISAKEQPLALFQLWRIPYPQGEALNLTNELAEYDTVSLAGNKIVTMRTSQDWQVWTSAGGDIQSAKPIRSGKGRSYGLNWTNSGKVLFAAMAGTNGNIFRIDADGSNEIQLTVNGRDNYMPAASPDGRYVVFSSYRNGSFNIWRMNAEDGSELRQLTFSDGNFYPSCSIDGWVFYDNQTSKPTTIWKVPIEGGAAVQVTDKPSRMPVVSPDGQFFACRYYDPKGDSKQGIAILGSVGGAPIKFLQIPIQDWQRIQWTEQGRGLTYIEVANGVSNIWRYDLASGSKKQLTHFNSDQIFAYGWSPDFRLFASERGSRSSDVTLITNP